MTENKILVELRRISNQEEGRREGMKVGRKR